MKKVRVTGDQIPTHSMSFLTTLLNFSKLISSLKAQVCNISKNYIDTQFFKLTWIFKIIPFRIDFYTNLISSQISNLPLEQSFRQLCRIYPPMTKLLDLTVCLNKY
jgi:hypothetical protein